MEKLRVAWLVPSVELGAYWLPVLNEFIKVFPQTIFYTGEVWSGFEPTASGASIIQVVGKTKYIETVQTANGCTRGFYIVSPNIIFHLFRFKPQIIVIHAFSLWTILAVLFKPIGRWQIVITYDGSSPNGDYQDIRWRSLLRKTLASFADGFVANSLAAKQYLLEVLKLPSEKVFYKTYLVPDAKALLERATTSQPVQLELPRPIFLYVGRILQRKGLKPLLEACHILKQQGYSNYTLMLVGEGELRPELEAFVKERDLSAQVNFVGWVEYGRLGAYFQQADIFVFPSFEDVWGMVVSEAMVFGKPVLCSQWANAAELILEGENGYTFSPQAPEILAEIMRNFLDYPHLIVSMGQRSQEIIAQHTPEAVAQFFTSTISTIHR